MQFELAPFALSADYVDAVLSRDDAKRHCVIDADDTTFDDEIDFYRAAAVDMVERYCGVALGERTGMVWRGETLCSPVDLGIWPVTAVTSIDYLDSDGAAASGTASDWRVVRRDQIALKPSKSLPSGVSAGVEITFNGGFAAGECPPALVQAARMFCAHLFRNRESVITGTISGEIPLGFRQLCATVRMPVI